MNRRLSLFLACLTPALAAFGGACGGQAGGPTQVLTGRVQQATFPAQVTQVRAYLDGARVADTSVAPDGSFSLTVPAGRAMRLELASQQPTRVIFPRSSGTIAVSFDVWGGGVPFDLGSVRYVGSPTGNTYDFYSQATEKVDCDDGHDASGAVCVEDDDENSGTCQEDSSADTDDSTDGSTSSSGDTTDESSGGSEDLDDTDQAAQDDAPSDAAVADHNFPADGCNAEDDTGSTDTSGTGDG